MQQGIRQIDTVLDAIQWVYASYNRAKPNLMKGYDRDVRHPEWTRELLERLGNPDYAAYNVAVTGSKGKGSHALLLAAILQQLGLRVGLFTSPHLVDFLERCRVNGQAIGEEEFVTQCRFVAADANQLIVPEDQYFGPVGLVAAVAARWFRDCHTDVNVIELGRGARHDDVNQIRHQGAVLSPVFLEHVSQLGPTLADIAAEKAGVITKDTRWLCSHKQVATVRQELRRSLDAHTTARFLGEDFGQTVHGDGRELVVRYPEGEYRLILPSFAGYMRDNTLVALDAARRVWMDVAGGVMPRDIDLSRLRLPGRLQVVAERPLTIVDGAIHELSAQYIATWLTEHRRRHGRARVGVILCLPADKDGEGVVRTLAPVVDWAVFTMAHNPHLVFNNKFIAAARDLLGDVAAADYIEDALALARGRLAEQDVLLLVGTQSFVGDVLRVYGQDTLSIWSEIAGM